MNHQIVRTSTRSKKILMTRTYIESLFSNCPLLDKFNVEINITCDDEVKHIWTPREDRYPLPRQGWCGEELREVFPTSCPNVHFEQAPLPPYSYLLHSYIVYS